MDDEYGAVGTINMDYRSLYLNFECGVWMYRVDSLSEMKKDFFETLEKSHEITFMDVKAVSFIRRVGRSILRLFAPWL